MRMLALAFFWRVAVSEMLENRFVRPSWRSKLTTYVTFDLHVMQVSCPLSLGGQYNCLFDFVFANIPVKSGLNATSSLFV